MKFEEVGRAIDQELAKLKEFMQQKVKPTTRQEMVNLLRKTAERLAKLAENLEEPEGGKQH
jgi:cell division protein ZapA (FtsZ GTPase activity inhibitor)